jgi:photosystem II protein
MSTTLSARASLTTSTFRSQSLVTSSKSSSSSTSVSRRAFVVTNAATISFVRDTVETSVPDVKLTKSRDGTSGTAFFTFENPDVFESASGDITGMYLTDEEGEMTTVCFSFLFYISSSEKSHRETNHSSLLFFQRQTNKQVDVNAKFVNGKPKCIEARYIMRSSSEWERFMRFMTRYAEDNGLGFNKKA